MNSLRVLTHRGNGIISTRQWEVSHTSRLMTTCMSKRLRSSVNGGHDAPHCRSPLPLISKDWWIVGGRKKCYKDIFNH